MGSQADHKDIAGHIYAGLLDDATGGYDGWPEGGPTLQKFDTLLRRAALFEGPLLLNDGYLLLEDWSREQLCDADSLVRRLIANGSIVVFTRQKDGRLEFVPEEMKSRVRSYRELTERIDWPAIRKKLATISDSAGYRWTKWFTPNNSHGFDLMLQRAFTQLEAQPNLLAVPPTIWTSAYDCFRKTRETQPERGSRDAWQESLSKVPIPYLGTLRNLGNEAYHFNMTALFAGQHSIEMSVQTRLGSLFTPHFCATRERPYLTQKPYHLPVGLQKLTVRDFLRVAFTPEVEEKKANFLRHKNSYEKNGPYPLNHLEDAENELFKEIEERAIAVAPGWKFAARFKLGKGIWKCTQLIFKDPASIGFATIAATALSIVGAGTKYLIGFVRFKPSIDTKMFIEQAGNSTGTIPLGVATSKQHYIETMDVEATLSKT